MQGLNPGRDLSTSERKLGMSVQTRNQGHRPQDDVGVNCVGESSAPITKLPEVSVAKLEELFGRMLNAAPVLIWLSGTDKLCTWFNQTWLDFVGRPLEKELGVGWTENLHPDDVQKSTTTYQQAFDARVSFTMEYRLRHRDGQYRWVLNNGVPLYAADQQFVGYIGSCTDITLQKDAEAALLAKDAELELIADATPLILIRCSRDLRYRFLNRAACELFGKRKEEIIGRPIVDFLGERAWLQIQPYVDRVLHGEPVRFEMEIDYPVGRRLVDAAYDPEFDREGQVVGWVASIVDTSHSKQMERSLRTSERRLRSLIRLMPAAMYTCDAQGRITMFNEVAERIWGRAPRLGDLEEKFCGAFRLYGPEGKCILRSDSPMAAAVLHGTPCHNREVTVERPDGSRRTVLVNIDPLVDGDGNLEGAVNIFLDITDHRGAERERDRFFELSDALLGICSLDDGRWLRVNPAFSRVLGWSVEQLRDRSGFETLHPDDVQLTRQMIQRLATGLSVTDFEHRVRCADGSYKWIAWSLAPYPSERLVYCVGRDMTETKKSLEALRASEERFRGLSETIPTMVWVCTPDGRFTYANPLWSAYTGLTCQQIQGFGWVETLHPDDCARVLNQWEECRLAGTQYEGEVRYRRRDGVYRWHYYRSVPIRDENKRITAWYGASLDIEERKATEAAAHRREEQLRLAAESANRAKSEFLANMSHEIRTPMTAILGYTDILAQYHTDPDDQSCLAIIRNNGNFLLEIINDILDLSKIDAGKLEIRRRRFRLNQLISDIRLLMSVRAQEKRIRLRVVYQGAIPVRIPSDRKRLKQILVNLVGTAIKFTDQGTVQLNICYLPSDPIAQMQFEVVDTGIGISPQQQARLFKPFTQLNAAQRVKPGGTGLGLVISQRFAELLGGNITVESEVGRGSKFSLIIPVGPPDRLQLVDPREIDVSAVIEPTLEEPKSRLRGRILVVDDRREMRFIAQHLIEEAGGEVIAAENGQEAIEIALARQGSQTPIDLIVMDMQMPVLDGFEATRRLRAAGFTAPIVALTAYAMEGDRQVCLEAGCTDYVAKPLNAPKFVKILAQYLESHSSAQSGAAGP